MKNIVFRKTLFIDKPCLSKNTVYQSKNNVFRFDKLCLSINTVYRLKNIVFRKTLFIDKPCLSKNTVYQSKNNVFRFDKPCLSINTVYQSKNNVFREKQCLSVEKQCFSLEKHCLSAINSVYRITIHWACHMRDHGFAFDSQLTHLRQQNRFMLVSWCVWWISVELIMRRQGV